MRNTDIVKLVILSAIWGGSFIFIKILAPVLGPLATSNFRILIAGIFLIFYLYANKHSLNWKINWKKYLAIGIINSAIPFGLYSYASLVLPASYEVILNSTAPLFGAIFSWIWLNDKFTWKKVSGLFLASIGVAIVVNISSTSFTWSYLTSIGACLLAAICYGLGGIYLKKFASDLPAKSIAGGSQLIAGFFFLPITLQSNFEFSNLLSIKILICLFSLALICSAIAYLLYYQLIADIGPTKALTVTFLMPIFGIIWGKVFLNELITFQMIFGAFIILIGTFLVVGKASK